MFSSKVTINTGNVLNLIDIKKKAGQNVSEELSESLKLTLSEWNSRCGSSNGSSITAPSEYMMVSAQSTPLNITRPLDDVKIKMAEEERKNLKIGVKIFINEDSERALVECLDNVFSALHTTYIDNVILAYNPEPRGLSLADDKRPGSNKASPISIGPAHTSLETKDEPAEDARRCEQLLPGIKVLWAVLEDYVKDGRVQQLGAADAGGACLRRLHAWARVKPAIAQINLASCCVVPPPLSAFCRANDVQLLTHSDPPDLLSMAAAKTLSDAGVSCRDLDWCARYQVHIKCRGVLALKGYVCKATVQQ